MKNRVRLEFCKGDWLAILLVAALSIACAMLFMPGNTSDQMHTVQVYHNSRLVREIPLSSNAVLEIDGDYHNTITIENSRVSISESSCPGEDCVHSGWIDSAGRSIVCLPNRVEIRISGESDVDFTVR